MSFNMNGTFFTLLISSLLLLISTPIVASGPYTIKNDQKDKLVSSDSHLPIGFSTIVIDPGHGGNDDGCKVNSTVEKNIALDIAKELGNKLKSKYPDLKVIYTRESDRYVSLQERIATANHNQADLFISIHCNYVKEKYVSGTETYVLGSDKSAEHLVKQEEGVYESEEFINSIRFKKLENHAYIKSLDLASKIEDSFAGLKGIKSRGVRHGAFRVLQMTSMPSVLVEAGFLSNKKDVKRLNSKSGQKKIAQSIFTACEQYFSELNLIEQEGTPNSVVKYYPQSPQPLYSVNVVKTAKKSNKTYQIQVAEFQSIPLIQSDSKWKDLKEIEIVQDEDRFLYMYGHFQDLASAIKKQEELNLRGFKGAFVVEKSEE